MATENPRLDPIGTLWKHAWNLYTARLAVLVQILLLPSALLALGGFLRTSGVPEILLGVVISFVGAIIFIFATIAAIFALYKKTDFGTSYSDAFKLFWPFIWLIIIAGFVIVGGFVMLIIPGIFLAVALLFYQYVFVVEGKRGMSALVQSRNYTRGYWWALFGRMLLVVIAIWVASFIFTIVGVILAALFGHVAGVLISLAITLLLVPFSLSYNFVLFENVRRIKPSLADGHSKDGRGFLVASGIVGIVVPLLVFALVITAVGFGAFKLIRNAAQNAADHGESPFANPVIFNLDPSSGPTGTEVTLYGLGLAATNTVEFDGLVASSLRDLPVSQDGTLTFTVPESVGPDCKPGEACAQFLKELTPGEYNVTVVENGVASNALVYTVTGEPLAP